MPTLSIIVPTPGRPTLARLLDSIAGQDLIPGDEIIICGDTHDGPLPETEALVASYGSGFRYLPFDAGHHAWGNPQRNFAIERATGEYLVFNDDDDIFTPGAFASIRGVAAGLTPARPLFFKFQDFQGEIRFETPGEVVLGLIGGHCIVAPNRQGALGAWTDRYQGDYDFITSTLERYPAGHTSWCGQVIAIARPDLGWKRVRTDEDAEELRKLRNAGREWMTRDTREISAEEQRRWWAAQTPDRLKAYLFYDQSDVVGAGILTLRDDGKWWITVLVAPTHRGRGIGSKIFRWLRYAPPAEIWAEIRPDNQRSLRAAANGYFYRVGSTPEGVLLVAR